MAKISAYPCAYNNLEMNKFLKYFSFSSTAHKEDIPLTSNTTEQYVIKKEIYNKQKFLNFFSISCKTPKGDLSLTPKFVYQDVTKKEVYNKENILDLFKGDIPLTPNDANQDVIKKEVYNKEKVLDFFSVSSKSSKEDIAFPPQLEADKDVIKREVHVTCLPIEECPQCYKELIPMQFTINIVTAVMKTICHCGLSIEINPKPTFSKSVTVSRKRQRSESHMKLKRLRLCQSGTDF